jgi:hypothetical protein
MKVEKGVQLGPYEILGALGKGGMGEVYLATDTRLDRRVALNHPNIITIHDIGNAADTHFIAYEFVDGIADGVPCGRAWLSVDIRLPDRSTVSERAT